MKRLSLRGQWTLTQASASAAAQASADCRQDFPSVSMAIPGDNYSALIQAGLMKDPYYAFNEQEALWAGRADWIIRKSFHWNKAPSNRACYLTIERADTFFTLRINGREAGKGDNYFRIWRFEISAYLKDGENEIELYFASAENEAVRLAQSLPYPIPFTQYDVVSPHRNLVRRIQCSAGWDWGPCLMTSGIYGDIYIEEVPDILLKSLSVQTEPLHAEGWTGTWRLSACIRCHAELEGEKKFHVALSGNGLEIHRDIPACLPAGDGEVCFTMDVQSPVLWKSADQLNGCGVPEGEPPKVNELYTLSIQSGDGAALERKIGFRQLLLRTVKEAGDKPGLGIYFELNGRPLFAKGSNFVPVDALPSRWTEERYRYFLESSVRANMNCLRFWGGGQYESDLCYGICDELGIIVWQDCAFACSLYPASGDFLASVEKELEDNVYRLQYHPSLAVWCGNNENLGALGWYEESRQNRDLYLLDYDRLNHGTVERTVRRCDPTRSWWPSSPCAGGGENAFADNWLDDSQGDMHFWSVWHGKEDMEKYMSIKPRFVSEFGYESFPSMEGLLEFTDRKHVNLSEPVMEYHQRSPSGNSIILENFSRYFRFPTSGPADQGPDCAPAGAIMESVLYLSQLQQALALKTAVQYWRSLRPHCMGAIYWQLNDVWPVTSWSSLEYSGKWKLAHYAARKFFAPVCLSLFKKDDTACACVINEGAEKITADVTIEAFGLDGKLLFSREAGQLEMGCDEVKCVWSMSMDEIRGILPEGTGTEDCFLYARMTARSDSCMTEADDTLFLERWKRCPLQKASIQAEILPSGQISLTSDKPAFYVAVDLPGTKGFFSDNMFTLIPGRKKTVSFTGSTYGQKSGGNDGDKGRFTKTLEKNIKLLSLKDTYFEG